MLLSVKGTFKDGVARPTEPIIGQDGRPVIITFLEEEEGPDEKELDEAWDSLMLLLDKYRVETGIEDLSEQHDHYLYGTPKRNGNEE